MPQERSLETSISTELIKEKLRNLKGYMPREDDKLYRFGEYLADRLGPNIFPHGFNISAERAIADLKDGIDSFTKQPIKNSLVGMVPVYYTMLSRRIPDIADAVCPRDFAEEVREFYEEFYREYSLFQRPQP